MATSRQRYLYTRSGSGTATETVYIDLWQNTSIQERKKHPQFRICDVKGGLIKDSNQDAVVEINVAPHTWVIKNSLRRGQRLWTQMIEGALEASRGSIKPRYLDYKVYLNAPHQDGATTLFAKDAEGNNLPKGEWNYSEYTSEDIDWNNTGLLTQSNRDADNYFAHIVGSHSTDATGTPNENWKSIGLVRSWVDTRAEKNIDGEPVMPAGLAADPLINLFDESDTVDEILNKLDGKNDRPPYDEDNPFGISSDPNASSRHLQRVAMGATQNGAGQIASINGFSAICGLVELEITTSGPGTVELLFDVETKGRMI